MADDAQLQLEYEQCSQSLRALTEIRFKLLAFVPTISGAAVAFLGDGSSNAQLLALGAIGLAATAGVLAYELGNSRALEEVAAELRAVGPRLMLPLGAASERAAQWERLGIALVYAAALGGWTYLVSWGALGTAGAGHARTIGGVIGGIAALAVFFSLVRTHRPQEAPAGVAPAGTGAARLRPYT
jgi:hypothetical protein